MILTLTEKGLHEKTDQRAANASARTANRGQPWHRGRGRRSQQMWQPRLCRPCPEPIQQGACQDPGAKSCATEYAGERMLPERDALCNFHGACRTEPQPAKPSKVSLLRSRTQHARCRGPPRLNYHVQGGWSAPLQRVETTPHFSRGGTVEK